MKRILSMVAMVAVLAFAGSAFATGGDKVKDKVNDHTCQGNADCSTNNVTNNNTTNQGGAGGAGGKGGNATSKATATGGNATGGSVKNSGNSSSSSSAKQSQSQKQGQAQSQNNNQQINVTAGGGAEKSVAYASPPSMGVASLVAAPETCMGSTSASLSGGNGIIGAGIGFGKTYESANCNRRMNARYLLSMGLGEAALALLAQDEDVAKALEAAGVPIPGKQQAKGGTDRAIMPTAKTGDPIGVTPGIGPDVRTDAVQSN